MNDELDVKTGVTDTLPKVLSAVVSKSLMVVVGCGNYFVCSRQMFWLNA
nr:hypothetical protein [Ligilactobacillus ruminis]